MASEALLAAARWTTAALGAADTDILRTTVAGSGGYWSSARITPKKVCAYRVTVQVASGSTLKVIADVSADETANEEVMLLNGGTALTAGAVYTFTFGARPGLYYDFRLGSDVAIDYLQVDECYLGTI